MLGLNNKLVVDLYPRISLRAVRALLVARTVGVWYCGVLGWLIGHCIALRLSTASVYAVRLHCGLPVTMAQMPHHSLDGLMAGSDE